MSSQGDDSAHSMVFEKQLFLVYPNRTLRSGIMLMRVKLVKLPLFSIWL